MKTSQTYRPVLVATRTIDSAAQAPKSALRGRMQRLGLTLLACTLVIGVIGSASAGQAQDEAAVRALGDNFAKAFVHKNAEQRASLFAENGTFVTPVGDFLQGRAAMKLTWRILVPHSTQLEKERIATGTPESEAGVRVVRRHHLLVRCSHWLNVPILLGLREH